MSADHPSTSQPQRAARVVAPAGFTTPATGETRHVEAAARPDEGPAYFIQGHRVFAEEMRAAMRRRDAAQASADRTGAAAK